MDFILLCVLLVSGSISSCSGELMLMNRHSGLRLATSHEMEAHNESVMWQMGYWDIAFLQDGRVQGPGHGSTVVNPAERPEVTRELVVLGEYACNERPPQGQLFSKDNFGKKAFPQNYCQFSMRARDGYRVHLTFISFSSKISKECSDDRIIVKDSNGSKLHKFCGKSKKSISIISSGSTLSFELDNYQASSEFLAFWEEIQDIVQQENGNHLISFPHTLVEDTEENVCVDLFSTRNERGNGHITIKLFTKEDLNSGKIQPKVEEIIPFSTNEDKKCHPIAISSIINTTTAFINLKATFENSTYGFNVFKEIQVAPKEVFFLVQTDKGKYKSNDTVKFRILLLDDALKPAQVKHIDEIWIEDSNNNRIKQWRNEALTRGILQKEFALSEEPVLGFWRIKFKSGNTQDMTRFEVAEYVLPKFEVKVEPISTIHRSSKNISWNVCGIYTHGGYVKGLVRWNVTTGMGRPRDGTNSVSIESGENCGLIELNLPQYSRYILDIIFLEVELEEEGTGIRIGQSWKGFAKSEELVLTEKNSPRIFTVGHLPYIGSFRTKHHDSTPASDIRLQVCLQIDTIVDRNEKCQVGNTDMNGDYNFFIPSSGISSNAQTMNIRAEVLTDHAIGRMERYQPQRVIRVDLRHVESSTAIMIENNGQGKLPCHQQLVAGVYISSVRTEAFDVHYHIISKGNILKSGTLNIDPIKNDKVSVNDITGGGHLLSIDGFGNRRMETFVIKKNIFIDIDHNVTPNMKLVVFSNEENEMAMDSLIFKVDTCLNHEVDFKWTQSKVNPGSPVDISIKAGPSSVCGISVTDKSVELLGNSNEITQEKVENLMEDIGQRKIPTRRESCNEFSKLFESSGVHILSDFSHLRSCDNFIDAINITDVKNVSRTTSGEGNCQMEKEADVYKIQCGRSSVVDPCEWYYYYGVDDNYDEYEYYSCGIVYAGGNLTPPPIEYSNYQKRKLEKMKKEEVDNANKNSAEKDGAQVEAPKVKLRNYFPETWLFQLENTNANGELTIPTNAPHTITEWKGQSFCINDQQGLGIANSKSLEVAQDFFAEISLPYSVKRGEWVFLNTSVFNKIPYQLPIRVILSTNIGDIEYENNIQEICVQAEDNSVVQFKIKALKLGSIDIMVSAQIINGIPECQNAKVGEGVSDVLTKPLLVKPEGFPVEKVETKLKCSAQPITKTFDLKKLSKPIKNLVGGSFRGWIQVTGDIMAPSLRNLGKLVRLPTGCGEQNMIGLVPNIFLLQYLDATNKREPELRKKAISYMQIGYKRQQRYRHNNGAYSIWGNNMQEGSTWLTAFVLKSFAMADRYINVDRRLLQQAVDWLMEGQMDNGCFRKRGYVHDKGLAGGSSNTSLTPFVFNSLLEARSQLGLNLNDMKLMKAMECMLANIDNADVYTSVLTAHAASRMVELGGNFIIPEKMNQEITKLWPKITSWTQTGIFNGSLSTPKAKAVEMTAYNLMTVIAQGKASMAPKIVKWLTGQRNSQGGFISTQDTVVALEALSMYASRIKDNLDMSVTITESHSKNANKKRTPTAFKLTQENALVLQSKRVRRPKNFQVKMEGQGCVMVQTVLRYNVHSNSKNQEFTLSVENVDNMKMKVCTRYTGQKEETNMVIVEVEMVTGWEVYRETVEELLNDVNSRIQRYEIDDKENKLVFYFDDMPKSEHCIEMEVKSVTQVEDAKAAIASVYDYNEPEKIVSIEYKM